MHQSQLLGYVKIASMSRLVKGVVDKKITMCFSLVSIKACSSLVLSIMLTHQLRRSAFDSYPSFHPTNQGQSTTTQSLKKRMWPRPLIVAQLQDVSCNLECLFNLIAWIFFQFSTLVKK